MTLKDIIKPIDSDLKAYNDYFSNVVQSDVALLDVIIKYISRKKGKQIRPVLVFMSAKLCGSISNRSFIGAAMVELLHIATLVHDDVVDEANERRGLASINAAWNNKIAVLIGDFFLAKGLLTAVGDNESGFLHATSEAIKRMSEGELLQIQKSRDPEINEDIYFRIISDKTASLMSACCLIGALSATADTAKHEALKQYGEMIGTAFQLRDDIFDYMGSSQILGKPVGNDLKEKKLTLPLIYALKNVSDKEAKDIVKTIKHGNLKKDQIKKLSRFAVDGGGIEYAEGKAKEYISRAIDSLSIFEDCPEKQALTDLANFVIERNK